MVKKEIISSICNDTMYNRGMVESVVDSLLYNIMWALSNGNKVQLAGFGTFEPKNCAPRTGRNPHTNEAVPIPARVVPSFKAGKSFKNAVIKSETREGKNMKNA